MSSLSTFAYVGVPPPPPPPPPLPTPPYPTSSSPVSFFIIRCSICGSLGREEEDRAGGGGGGGGGGLLEALGGVQPASQNPDPIYDQNLRYSLPYLWPDQIFDTLFMPWSLPFDTLFMSKKIR